MEKNARAGQSGNYWSALALRQDGWFALYQGGLVMKEIRNIFSPTSRNLIREFIIANFKYRYKGTVLGFFWYLLYPLIMFVILYAIFSHFLGEKVAYYPLFLLCGIIMWTFFERTTSECLPIIYNNSELIKKTYFPRETLIISPALANLLEFFLELVILAIFVAIFGQGLVWPNLFLFLVLFCEVLIVAGTSLLLSALYVFYKDLIHIWRVALRLAFFATPIIYPESVVPAKLNWVIRLNPFTYLLRLGREVFVYGHPPQDFSLGGLVLFSLAIFVFGWRVFKKREPLFAEKL